MATLRQGPGNQPQPWRIGQLFETLSLRFLICKPELTTPQQVVLKFNVSVTVFSTQGRLRSRALRHQKTRLRAYSGDWDPGLLCPFPSIPAQPQPHQQRSQQSSGQEARGDCEGHTQPRCLQSTCQPLPCLFQQSFGTLFSILLLQSFMRCGRITTKLKSDHSS